MRPWIARRSLILLALLGAFAPDAAAQQGRTEALAKQLAGLLDARKLDSIAARQAGSDDTFVAALYFPGSQLLVISAKYAAPPLMNEKIIQGNYRDCYIDLNVAVDPSTKVFVEDLLADGIRATRAENTPFDTYTKGDARFPFDGEWKKRKVKEDEYMKRFSEAEADYTRMLEALIAQLQKSS